MAKELTWSDADDIGILLSETHPTIDPLAIRFTDLQKYVIALPDFKDDPTKSTEPKARSASYYHVGSCIFHARLTQKLRSLLGWRGIDVETGAPFKSRCLG